MGPCAVKHNQLTVLCINRYKISRDCNRRRGFNASDVRGCSGTSMDLWLLKSAAKGTVPYAACVQLCPPEDEYLILETCRAKINKVKQAASHW